MTLQPELFPSHVLQIKIAEGMSSFASVEQVDNNAAASGRVFADALSLKLN